MSMTKDSHVSLPIAEERRRDLIVRFLADITQVTDNPKNQEEFQTSLQTYCDALHPGLDSNDGPPDPRAIFSLEAEALFRAWLRRHKIWSDAGLNTTHAWLN